MGFAVFVKSYSADSMIVSTEDKGDPNTNVKAKPGDKCEKKEPDQTNVLKLVKDRKYFTDTHANVLVTSVDRMYRL